MEDKKIYAAYGSNMNILQMQMRCPNSKLLGTGTLNDYRLEFRGDGVATIVREEGKVIPIVLWEITQNCERCLDVYEGFPRMYIKQYILVKTDTSLINAMAYIMNEPYCEIITKPSNRYYNVIKEGYLQNHIDTTCLEEALDAAIFHLLNI